MNIAEKLYLLRKKQGMSQLELAEHINVSRQAISKWEMGVSLPSTENLISLSKLYHVSLDSLVNDNIDIQENTEQNRSESKDLTKISKKFGFENIRKKRSDSSTYRCNRNHPLRCNGPIWAYKR